MRPSPQLECTECEFPVLMSFVEHRGDERTLRCPACDHAETWQVRSDREACVRPLR